MKARSLHYQSCNDSIKLSFCEEIPGTICDTSLENLLGDARIWTRNLLSFKLRWDGPRSSLLYLAHIPGKLRASALYDANIGNWRKEGRKVIIAYLRRLWPRACPGFGMIWYFCSCSPPTSTTVDSRRPASQSRRLDASCLPMRKIWRAALYTMR